MQQLHRMILRMLPGPFLGWLYTLMFLLLMQFLIKYLPDIAGKGLPFRAIVELVAYNLAYMLVLAVPMSLLIATILVFGKLTETRVYAVVKTAGVSPLQLIWPTLLVGLIMTGCMVYFNNEVLPEANFRARNLWQDIRKKKPGFELQAGLFYEGLDNYSILVRDIPPGSDELHDVLIYDYTEGSTQQSVIKAARGALASTEDGAQIVMTLEDGEIHRKINVRDNQTDERYERIAFGRYRLRLDLSDFIFERSDPREGYRSDRTMRTADMVRLVDSLDRSIAGKRMELFSAGLGVGRTPPPPRERSSLPRPAQAQAVPVRPIVLSGMDSTQQREVYDLALQKARNARAQIDERLRLIDWEHQRADRYRVEIHKKYSIALACLIFALIGAPLGLSIRRGGLGMRSGLAIGIFLFYWVTLVQGEKLADRGYLPPWLGMWGANLVMLALGLWLLLYISLDLQGTPPLRQRLRQYWKARRATNPESKIQTPQP